MAFAIPVAASIATAVGAPATAAAITAAGTAGLGTALSIGSTAFSVLGALKSAQGSRYSAAATNNASRYNAAVATNNAILARRNADLAGQQGEANVAASQAATRAKVGGIKAAQAASGIDVNYGSAVDVRSSAAETGQLSALSLRSEAARKAYGYQQLERDYKAESKLQKATGASAITAGDIEADATLLGGVSQAGMGYAQYLENRSPLSLSS